MSADVQIRCRNIWKLFGPDPERFLSRQGGHPDPAAIREGGYIGAVQDVSFDVHRGEILIIMGLSGSGKSTLIRCITRLNDPTAGEMEYEGRDLLNLS
ncbi:MAG: ATP-binding cassette domain-containing protein, partial [Pseudomonadota bacterium]